MVLWRPLLMFRPGHIEFGHWWFELGDDRDAASESYGWWPQRMGEGWRRLFDLFLGVPGELNGRTMYPTGRNNQDVYHGWQDDVTEVFHPAVAANDQRTEQDIEACLRQFAVNYQGKWQWIFDWGQNCHSFQIAAMRHCRLERGPSVND
jgi:hypothetical protein